MQIESKFFLPVVGTPNHYLAKMNSFNLYALTGGWEQKTSNPARARARALLALALGTGPPRDRTPRDRTPPKFTGGGEQKTSNPAHARARDLTPPGTGPPGTGPPGTRPPLKKTKLCRVQ